MRYPMGKVLIIDDDAATLKAYTAVLTALEPTLSITNALCAETALRYVCAVPFDAVVCDFMLPGLDGLDFVMECARVQRDTPVILVTGYGHADLERTAAQQGVYAVLHKPVEPEAFRSVVIRAILHKRVTGTFTAEETCHELIQQLRARLQHFMNEDVGSKTDRLCQELHR
jgi:DNA-binding NtrC family response regulator